jgi:S1-C subfamily serine protease
MKRRAFLSSHFGSAVIGGLVVAVAGLIAIQAGWVDGDDESSSGAATAARARPSSGGEGVRGLSVNEIYARDSDGVVFILAQQSAGAATGAGFVIDDEGHILTNAHVVEGAHHATREARAEVGGEEGPETAHCPHSARGP